MKFIRSMSWRRSNVGGSECQLRCRLLSAELLEPRLALAVEAFAVGPPTGTMAVRPFLDGLWHEDSLVRAAIAAITTTAPADVTFSIGGPEHASPALNSYEPSKSDAQSGDLVRLPQFHADPRFTNVDGSGYSVVVLDTGIDLNHPFFGPDGNSDGIADRIVYNADFATGRPNADDFNGHGTHVASIIGSQDAAISGMAPGVNLIALKVLSDAGSGTAAAIEAALQWVVANVDAYNIVSVNLSLTFADNHASPTTRPEFGLSDELAAIAAQNVIIASASGNLFFDYGSAPGVAYPSADPSSLSIGAVWDANAGGPIHWAGGEIDYSTGEDRIVSFSQRHPTLTTVFAPGAAIAAAAPGGGTTIISGTSQATPHVSGIAALIQQLAVQETGRRLSLQEFASLAQLTGDAIFDGDDEHDNVQNTQQYFRRIDILGMANAVISEGLADLAVAPGLVVSSPTIASGGQVRFDVTVANKGLTSVSGALAGVYLSEDHVIDDSDLLLTQFVDEIAAGQFVTRTNVLVQVPPDLPTGDYFLGVLLDHSQLVAEGDEQNNSAAIPLALGPSAPEIFFEELTSHESLLNGVSSLSFRDVPYGTSDVVKTLRVHNDGTSQLLLSSPSVPAGYVVAGFPTAVEPLGFADFTIAMLASSAEGDFHGAFSFVTNDVDESEFSVDLLGSVDRGDDAASAGAVDVDSSAAGTIAPAADRDWFAFQAVQHVRYEFDVALGTLSDSVLRLIDANGITQLGFSDNVGGGLSSLIDWQAPNDGVYYLEVSGKGSQTGSYQLGVSATDDHGDAAALATFTTDPSLNHGYIEAPGDADWFRFMASSGVAYQFAATLLSLENVALRVVDADGTTVFATAASSSSGASISWVAPATDAYYLAVEAQTPGSLGSYDLQILGADDYGDNADNANGTEIPSLIDGRLDDPEDADWFSFELVAGARYRLTAASGLLLRILELDGATELARGVSSVEWISPAAGLYYASVSQTGTIGAYTLIAEVVDDHGNTSSGATAISDPASISGVVEAPGDVDAFSFPALAGIAYQITATPQHIASTSIRVLASDGITELASQPGMGGEPTVLAWTAPSDGVYFFDVRSATTGGVGAYNVLLLGDDDYGDNPQNAAQLTISTPLVGDLERAGDSDWFALTTIAGLMYRIAIDPVTLAKAAVHIREANGVTVVDTLEIRGPSERYLQWEARYNGHYFIQIADDSTESLTAGAGGPLVGGTYSISATLQSPLPGDFDADADADGNDFLVWQRSYAIGAVPALPLDSLGFEDYQSGPLASQFGWQQLGPPTGSAVVQSDVVRSGERAVRVDRAPGADNRWGVPLGDAWPTGNGVVVTWDMRVVATGNEESALGPFLGVEAYDDKGVFGLLGTLGVDATTLDVLYQREDDGSLVESGIKVLPDVWYSFRIFFDFTHNQYTIYLDDAALATTGFVDRGANHDALDQFTDADISALAAQANSPSQLIAGTAYFDNFRILDVQSNPDLVADANRDGLIDGVDLHTWEGMFGISAVDAGNGSVAMAPAASILENLTSLQAPLMLLGAAPAIQAAAPRKDLATLLAVVQSTYFIADASATSPDQLPETLLKGMLHEEALVDRDEPASVPSATLPPAVSDGRAPTNEIGDDAMADLPGASAWPADLDAVFAAWAS